MAEWHRGDSYISTITLEDTSGDDPAPLDLAGKRITVTCREKLDGPIVYEHWIEVNDGGSVTSSQGMALESTADAGIIIETFSSTETAAFKPTKSGKSYTSDLEIRVIGDPDVVTTPIKAQAEKVTGDYTLPPG